MNQITNTEKYWMDIADQIAQASTCRVKIGCVLVHKKIIVGTGFVGSVSGDAHCHGAFINAEDDVGCMLVETDIHGSSERNESCIRTMHAEMNAVLKCQIRGNKQNGWIMAFCTYQPCLRCLQAMLQIGVRIIIYRKSYRDVWRDRYLQETKTLFDIRKYNENNELFVMSGNAYYSEFAANKNKGQQTTPFIYWDGI